MEEVLFLKDLDLTTILQKRQPKETADQMVKSWTLNIPWKRSMNKWPKPPGSTRAVKISKEFAEEAAKQK